MLSSMSMGGHCADLFGIGLINASSFLGMCNWRESRWVKDDKFLDVWTGTMVKQRIHVFWGLNSGY